MHRLVSMTPPAVFAAVSFFMTCCYEANADCMSDMGKANTRNFKYLQSQGISNGAQLQQTPRTCTEAKRFIALIKTQVDFWRNRMTCGQPLAASTNAEEVSSWTGTLKIQERKESELCKNEGAEASAQAAEPSRDQKNNPQHNTSARKGQDTAHQSPPASGCPDDVGPGMLLTNPGISLEGSTGCNDGAATNPQLQGPLHKGELPNMQGNSQPRTPEGPGVSSPNPPLIADNGPSASPNPSGGCPHGSVPIGSQCVPCTDFKPESPTAQSPACQSTGAPSNTANQQTGPDQKGTCSQGAMFYIKSPPRTGNARTGDCMGTCYVFENSCSTSAIKLTYRASTGYGNNCSVLQTREITVPAGKPGSAIDFSCSVPSIDNAEFTK